MRENTCLVQSVFFGSRSKRKKKKLLKTVYCIFKHGVVMSSLPMSLVNLQF